MSVINVNVTNAGAANVSVSNGSTVNATVGNGGAVNVSTGTISPGNATVVSGTLTINSTTTLAAGSQAYVKNDAGTAYAAKLDIGIPAGPATLVSVGNTTTLAAGSNATVTGTTSGGNLALSFAIPAGSNGINGITPTFSASASTLSAGCSATVTATSSNGGANVALAFGIPAGAAGSGSGSNLTLSDATPSNLGTAAAGTSNLAARADHTHNLPVIAYANLSGVPSNFATNTTLVSGLSSGYSGIGHAHNYVTALNNLTGALTLAAGSNVTLTANGSTLTITAAGGLGENDSIDGGVFVGSVLPVISVTQQPTSQTASSGAATFTVAATVTQGGTATYQWQKQESGAGAFANVTGATGSSLSLSSLTNASDNGDAYRVIISSPDAISVTSQTVTLSVSAGGGGAGTDSLFSSVSTLLHFDGSGTSITDNAPTPKTYTAIGSATQSTSQSQWGSSSLYLTGSDYIETPSNAAFNFGSGNFAAECWIRPSSVATNFQPIMGQANYSGNAGWSLWLNYGRLYAMLPNVGEAISPQASVVANSWQYVAISRSGSQLFLYVNGLRVASADLGAGAAITDATTPFQVGGFSNQSWNNSYRFTGYIDDIRVTKASRGYTGETIAVPTAAFPNS
jgi:hypothetical protein